MKAERVRVAFGSTVNLGNYNTIRLDVELIAAVEEGEDWHAVVALPHEEAKAEVKRQAAASRPKGRGPGDGWGE